MSRRRKSVQRDILPDPRYKDVVLAKFVRALMINGKKNTAEKLIYSSFDIIEKKEKEKSPLEVFKSAFSKEKTGFSHKMDNCLSKKKK